MRINTNRDPYSLKAIINDQNHITRMPLHEQPANPAEDEAADACDRAWADGWRSNVICTAVLCILAIAMLGLVITIWILHSKKMV